MTQRCARPLTQTYGRTSPGQVHVGVAEYLFDNPVRPNGFRLLVLGEGVLALDQAVPLLCERCQGQPLAGCQCANARSTLVRSRRRRSTSTASVAHPAEPRSERGTTLPPHGAGIRSARWQRLRDRAAGTRRSSARPAHSLPTSAGSTPPARPASLLTRHSGAAATTPIRPAAAQPCQSRSALLRPASAGRSAGVANRPYAGRPARQLTPAGNGRAEGLVERQALTHSPALQRAYDGIRRCARWPFRTCSLSQAPTTWASSARPAPAKISHKPCPARAALAPRRNHHRLRSHIATPKSAPPQVRLEVERRDDGAVVGAGFAATGVGIVLD
jgi:hypothetical protein